MKLIIINIENGKIRPKCCSCNSYAEWYKPHPYESEINGDYTKVYICESCYLSASDAI